VSTGARKLLTAWAALCERCQAEWMAWLDYREPLVPRLILHAGYDGTAKGMLDNQRAAFERWRCTVRGQQELIERICAAQHVPPRRPTERLVVTGGLL
jgi:hypothetical protein